MSEILDVKTETNNILETKLVQAAIKDLNNLSDFDNLGGNESLKKIDIKLADARNKTFYKQRLLVKKNGSYISLDLLRKDVFFRKGEKVLLYRYPGIMDNGWTYQGNGTISKMDGNTKYVIENLSNAFIYKVNETQVILSEIEYQSRKQEYLKKNNCMKSRVFDQYFSKDSLGLQDGQGNIGNCYFLADLRSLMESPNYETLIRTSVSITSSDKGENWVATVRLPLGSKDYKEYKIYPKDVLPQKNKFYNPGNIVYPQVVPLQSIKWDKFKNKYYAEYFRNPEGKLIPKLFSKSKEYLYPLRGPVGIRILESAYIKMKDKINNDNSIGGFDRLKMVGGLPGSSMMDMIGESNGNLQSFGSFGYKSISEQGLSETSYKYFDTFVQYKDYGALASKNAKGKTDQNEYMVPGTTQKVVYKHAYSIVDTNPIKKTVTVVNPWKLDQTIIFSYKQVCEAFSFMSCVDVDFENSFT